MRTRLGRDECGDQVILGTRGNIHEGTLGGATGYYISLIFPTVRKVRIELRKCLALDDRTTVITLEGDTEAVIFIPRDLALEHPHMFRESIKARRSRLLS